MTHANRLSNVVDCSHSAILRLSLTADQHVLRLVGPMSQKCHNAKPQRELELKFSATHKELDLLALHLGRKRWDSTAPVEAQLQSIYFDTPSYALRDARYSFRVRKVGATWHQTVKGEIGVRGGISNPVEIECVISEPRPDLSAIKDAEVRRYLRSIIGSSDLLPIFETHVSRTVRTVKVRDGSRVELALDRAVVKAEDKSEKFAEVEIELKKGNPRALLKIASQITKMEPFQLSETSKSDRGYQLLSEITAPRAVPVKMSHCELSADHTCAEAFQIICATSVNQILQNWRAVLDGEDPEGPHQLRIGIRYLRSVLRAFRPVFDSKKMRKLEVDLRHLARIVGKLRDLDVLKSDIVQSMDKSGHIDTSFVALEHELSLRVSKQRIVLRKSLAKPKWSRMQVRLALLPIGAGWDSKEKHACKSCNPIKELSAKALDKRWVEVAKLGAHINTLTVPERHDLRKKLKVLRYTLQAFSSLYATKDTKRFVGDLKHLQDRLGYLNDTALAWRLLDMELNQAQNDPHLQHAIGFVVGYHAHCAQAAWKDAQGDWEKLRKVRRPWD